MQFTALYRFLRVVSTAAVIASCARSVATTRVTTYKEDLSAVRPTYVVVPVATEAPTTHHVAPAPPAPRENNRPLHVNKRLQAVIDTLTEQNKAVKYINGFRIQLYVGNQRRDADAAKAYVYQFFQELTPYMSYTQPTYRVKTGDFIYRFEAEPYLEQIKNMYPSAVIVAERVEIKKALQVNAASK